MKRDLPQSPATELAEFKAVLDEHAIVASTDAQIVKAAEELNADLIVMPTRGFTPDRSGEIGSTAERVVYKVQFSVGECEPRFRRK